MISLLRDRPIQRKLMLVILLSCAAALLGAMTVQTTFQILAARDNFARDLSTLGEVIASNTTAAVAFKDARAGNEVLSALKAKEQVLSANVLLLDGSIFCSFGEKDLLPSGERRAGSAYFVYDRLTLRHFQPIRLDGEQIGTLYMRSDFGPELLLTVKRDLLILVAVIGIALLIAFLISRWLQGTISEPISKLAGTATAIARKKDYAMRAEKFENDEVGALTDAFNDMLRQIESQDTALRYEIQERKRMEQEVDKLHKQVLATSRQAGMAEVATGVLHNVGNVLNSVNISTTLLRELIAKSRGQNINRLADLLRSRSGDLALFVTEDPRGKALPEYLTELGQRLDAERARLIAEIEGLGGNIEHIKEIVAMQQNYAKVSGVIEVLPLVDLVEDSLRMNTAAFIRHQVEIERDFQPIPPVVVDKHKVLQILTNLLRNAKYAVDEPEVGRRHVRVTIQADEAGGFAQVIVSDSGVGIAPENLTRIFGHGFTTRKEGHGFGLHSGALAATEIGGSLSAHSEGLGKGATFILSLPLAKKVPDTDSQSCPTPELTTASAS